MDSAGHLIDINTAIYSQSGGSQGIGFAIPVSLARQVMEQIITTGRVSRGWLGINAHDAVDEDNNTTAGATLAELLRNGPADKAGLRTGDTITAINSKPVANTAALVAQTSALLPGATAQLEILRNGQKMNIAIVLGMRPKQRNR